MADTGVLVAGLVLLAVGSGRFVEGAAGLALRLRVSMTLVGAVVIGFGTSLPELLVSVLAALEDAPGIAVGNVVGSNVANLTLILGVVGVLAAPWARAGLLRREAPMCVVAMAAFGAALWWGQRLAGVGLLVLFVTLNVVLVRAGRVEDPLLAAETEEAVGRDAGLGWWRLALDLAGGITGTLVGAQLVVAGATGIAGSLGLDEGFVGFTIVAVGTSLPELVTAVQAALRDEPDLAVGNVFGSNLFNSLAIGGTVTLVGSAGAGRFVVPVVVMVGVGLLTWALLARGMRLSRWDGAGLLVVYAGTVAAAA